MHEGVTLHINLSLLNKLFSHKVKSIHLLKFYHLNDLNSPFNKLRYSAFSI